MDIFFAEASDTGFVFLVIGPAVARLGRDSALSGQFRLLCAFHRDRRIAVVTGSPLSFMLIS
jgi:hypothetical protein